MAKRESDIFFDGPPAKLMKDDADDGSSGRTGRVRKKSAKVLEMEEFEHAEKTTTSVKKTKTPKAAPKTTFVDAFDGSGKKVKMMKTSKGSVDSTPTSSKSSKVSFMLEPSLGDTDPQAQGITNVRITSSGIETSNSQKSVIKNLLSSPTAGSGDAKPKKEIKRVKALETSTPKSKNKPKTPKSESLAQDQSFTEIAEAIPSLKLKIIGGSDPASASVAMSAGETPKQKKAKKVKQETQSMLMGNSGSDSDAEGLKLLTKKTTKKNNKKEKLTQEAITVAQHQPVLQTFGSSLGLLPVPAVQKQKKKIKGISPSLGDSPLKSDLSFDEDEDEDDMNDDAEDEDEGGLVIAEMESKKTKPIKKKAADKAKSPSSPSKNKKSKDDKKQEKRSPTAYMLFCNTNRPQIINENPGIEFATISRKLGEMWQALPSKQRLMWKKKAGGKVEKKSKGMISTGKAAAPAAPAPSVMMASQDPSPRGGVSVVQRSPRADELPDVPTEGNHSIEPIDVAAHLKLLGESLSIIGMRLQEHKGLIAVQGSLSVLLDSLLCSCGPLLALTQQVPGMEGCTSLQHAQTLDSVAYVMPGL